MMLRQSFVKATLFLFLLSIVPIVHADNESTDNAVRQTVENYCKIEFQGAWVEDRWAMIKLNPKREKSESKYREITDSAVFQLEHYPFIVIDSYDIRDVKILSPKLATAQVVYRRVAHSESEPIRGWHLVADPMDNDLVTLNLVFDKNQWWMLDPPPPRISKKKLIGYYEYQVNRNLSRWDQELSDPQYDEEQKANIRASRDQAVGALRILKSLP